MKKILCLCILCFIFLCPQSKGTDVGAKWGLLKTDSVLCELLNIPTNDPFWTDTIRHDYLRIACSRISSLIPLKPFRALEKVPPNVSLKNMSDITGGVVDINGVIRWVDTDSAYSLIEINSKAVGQKEIATASSARYYWWELSSTGVATLYIYPPTTVAGDSAKLTVFGYSPTSDFATIRQIAHDKILLYCIYKAYFQKGEIDIADKYKKLTDILIFDQKSIMENRPIDITMKKKVLAK